MAKKVITVFGSTGVQGGSIVRTFLNDPALSSDWQVRGVTRDVTKESAKALSHQGVEMVGANMDDMNSLAKAMEGSDVVYALTNYWDTMDMDKEIRQGKNLADAAREANVGLYIWSSLINVSERTGGKLPHVYHFDSKAKVEEYVRSLGIPASFFMPGFYMSNLPGGMFRQTPPHNNWTLSMPVPSSALSPVFDAANDTGKFVKAIVLNKEKSLGKNILGATKYMTGNEIVGDFKKVFPEAGKTAGYFEVPQDMFLDIMTKQQGMPQFVAQEMLENLRLLNEGGYYFGESLDWSHSLVADPLTTWEEHARTAKAFADLK